MDWLYCFRVGFAPEIGDAGLRRLRDACATHDPMLVTRAVAVPFNYSNLAPVPCEGACAIGMALLGEGLVTNAEVEEGFGRLCFAADRRLGGPGECRWFLNHYDDCDDRAEILLALREEVESILAQREKERAA